MCILLRCAHWCVRNAGKTAHLPLEMGFNLQSQHPPSPGASLSLKKPSLKTCSVLDTHSSLGDRDKTRLGPYPPTEH